MNTILLVDDEPVILTVLKGILARSDREFVTAETAGQAIGLAQRFKSLEVAILDKNLPDRNGLEVARELKHMHPDVEVIMLTGYASLDSAIEAVKVGAFDYIQKPIEDFDDLNLKVQRAAEKVQIKREQRRLLDRFAENEERYRGVFQASADALFILDPELGRIHDANPAAQRLYGFSREELVALSADDLGLVGLQEPSGLSVQAHVRKGGGSFRAEVALGSFQFQRRSMRLASVRDASGREAGAGDHPARAQRMEAVSRLAATVARELRPLVSEPSVAGILVPLAAFAADDRTLEPVDLNRLLNDAADPLQQILGEIPVAVSAGGALGRVRADAKLLREALLALAQNARDAFAGTAAPRLVIETANAELGPGNVEGLPPGRCVTLSVSDNGPGFSEAARARAFEPFFSTRGAGRGRGLAVVWAAARAAGGTVRLVTQAGAGSTVKLVLPRLPDEPTG